MRITRLFGYFERITALSKFRLPQFANLYSLTLRAGRLLGYGLSLADLTPRQHPHAEPTNGQ